MKKYLSIVTTAAMLSACSPANSITPVIDTASKGFNGAKYSRDLQECREYANERDATTEAAFGALAGALLGYSIGAVGYGGKFGQQMGRMGAVGGAVGGFANAGLGAKDILVNCLNGRGYKVLGTSISN